MTAVPYPRAPRVGWPLRGLRALWWPTPRGSQRLAGAVAVVLGLVIVTGAAVRLSGSGLGCPTWPRCTATALNSGTDLHGLIEFGNRVISAVVFLVGILLLAVMVGRSRRRDLYPLIALLFAGYLAEAVLGGLTVLTRLNPLLVGAHFLLAVGLLWAAVVIWRRLGAAAVPPTPLVGRELRWVGRGLVAGAAAVLVVGTLVTGSGPYAGSRVDNRLPFDRQDITQLHSDLVLLVVGATAVALVLLRVTAAPAALRRRGTVLLCLLVGQAAIGFTQYFTGLPAWLVGVHVAGAAAFWVACLLFALDMYGRPAAPG